MVGSVVKARQASAMPDNAKRVDPVWDAEAGPKSARRRRARMAISSPLMMKVAVIIHP